MIISAGTIVSSLASERLNTRLGTGRVTALSVATTAVALFGFSICTQFWQLCLWAIPYGLGAGSVDAALNNYVALHYESRHMSWLHCMWGIGAAGGPVIMGWALAGSTWQNGYRIISILQIVLTAVLIFSLPLWQTPADAGAGEDFTPEHRTLPQLMKVPGVPEVMCCFALYYGRRDRGRHVGGQLLHIGTRAWMPTTAASWASLFYLGITVGRFLSGFLTMKFNDHQMIRMGQVLIAVGIALVFLPAGSTCPAGWACHDRAGLRADLSLHHPRDARQLWQEPEHGNDRHPNGCRLHRHDAVIAAFRRPGAKYHDAALPLGAARHAVADGGTVGTAAQKDSRASGKELLSLPRGAAPAGACRSATAVGGS